MKEHDLYGKMASVTDMPIDLRKLQHYSAYYSGMRKAILKVIEHEQMPKMKDDDVYWLAELNLALRDVRSAQLWSDGKQIAFRNHKRDKKGKLVFVGRIFTKKKQLKKKYYDRKEITASPRGYRPDESLYRKRDRQEQAHLARGNP